MLHVYVCFIARCYVVAKFIVVGYSTRWAVVRAIIWTGSVLYVPIVFRYTQGS